MQGLVYTQMGETKKAMPKFESALSLKGSKDVEARSAEHLAKLYHELPATEAKSKLSSLMGHYQDPRVQAAGHYILGIIYLREKAAGKAALEFDEVRKKFPQSIYARLVAQQ